MGGDDARGLTTAICILYYREEVEAHQRPFPVPLLVTDKPYAVTSTWKLKECAELSTRLLEGPFPGGLAIRSQSNGCKTHSASELWQKSAEILY